MKLYIWPNGQVHDFIPPDMSDDFFEVETDNWMELQGKINTQFGDTEQSIHVIMECEYWTEMHED